jgi:hypothetical protein
MKQISIYVLCSLFFVIDCGTGRAEASPTTKNEESTAPQQVELQAKYMQLKFNDPSWSFHLLRRMGYAPSGGADIAECLNIAEAIREGDLQSWYVEWNKAANRLLSFSNDALFTQSQRDR